MVIWRESKENCLSLDEADLAKLKYVKQSKFDSIFSF